MRVLHVSQPVEAGVAAVAFGLLSDQRLRGWDARLACPAGELAVRAEAASIPVSSWSATRGPGRSLRAEVRALRALIEEHDPDVVHLHSSKAGLAGRLAVGGVRPIVFQPHAWSFDAARGAVRAAALGWERFGATWTDLLLCVSGEELQRGRSAGVSGSAMVIPNGVDTAHFVPRPVGPARSELGLPDAPIVLCLGRIAEQKGQDLLLRAWPQVRQAVPDAVLLIVGDGPAASSLRAGSNDPSVVWRSAVKDPRPYYAAADVVVLPSRWEGMPLVALEALASGRPVVGFDVTGMREAIGNAGAVVRFGALASLAGALVERLRPEGPAAEEGSVGRARIVDRYDHKRCADSVAEATTDLYRRGARR